MDASERLNMKKTIIFALVFAITVSFAACASGGQGKGTSGLAPTGVDSSSATTDVQTGNLPDTKYNGRNFRISMGTGFNFEFYTTDDSGDVVDSALYKRNSIVEDRYEIRIKPVYTNGTGLYGQAEEIILSVQTDNDDYDMTSTMVAGSGGLISWGVLLDWADLPYTDLSASWWNGDINEKYRLAGHTYLAVGDTCMSTLTMTYAMMMNRSKATEWKITDEVFAKVRKGEWTIDYFDALVRGIYGDIDGEQGATPGDFYGFAAENLTNLDVYPFAFDIPMVVSTGDDDIGIELVIRSDKMVSAVDKILKLYWSNTGSYISTEDPFYGNHKFIHGTAMFATMTLDNAFHGLREMTDDYTILPYPKYDENQKKYKTSMMDNFSVLGVPISVPDAEFVSVIAEALNIEAEKYMYPAYYEDALQDKYKRDEETVEFLNLLMDGRTTDLSVLISINISGVNMMFRDIVNMKENLISSYCDSKEEAIRGQIKNFIDAIKKNAAMNG